jgi:glycosyltransferase involved in cell wall biosynthesis
MNGYKIIYSNLLSKKDDQVFYSKGKYVFKFQILIKSLFIRTIDFFKAFSCSHVFIYREAFMLGTTFFERLFRLSGAKIIFDFDDAIWLNDTSQGNIDLIWLKNPNKYKKIIELSDIVFAGNNYLADYAAHYNPNVKIFPTVLNTDLYISVSKKEKKTICIGWTGSSTTFKHFETAIPFLTEIKNRFHKLVYFKVIVNIEYRNENLDIVSTPWNINSEIEDLAEIDIGIMPLPDDDWSKGKCGFKGLQYMSLAIPTIMSPVGVNSEIIQDGVNGYLASSHEEWIDKISRLIESQDLRKNLGLAGQQTVIEKYSVSSQKEVYLEAFNSLVK